MFCSLQGVTPVLGVRGKATRSTGTVLLWSRPRRRFGDTNPNRILPPHPPPLGAPSPRGEGFWGRSPPHPSRLRRATFPPRGRLLRGTSSSAPFGGTCPYPLCRYATSSLPLLAYGHFPLTGGIGPLTRGVGPQGEGFGGEGPSFVPGGRLEKCGGKLPCEKTDKELILCRPKPYKSTPNSSSSRTF